MGILRDIAIAGIVAIMPWASAWAQTPEIAIFYDGPQPTLAEGYLDATQIANLLGHFGLRGKIEPLANYQKGQLAAFRATFFVGTVKGTHFPAGFLDEVRASGNTFCWLGRHIGNLVDTRENQRRLGFSYVDYRDDLEFKQVLYKGVTLPKEDPELNIVQILGAASVQVLATARNTEGVTHPYAIRKDHFWYFADSPFSFVQEGSRYLVFCDLLHDILGIDHPPSMRALVRLEDVSTDSDADGLREIANLLGRRNVPFQIAVIPIYRKPSQGLDIRLSDRPYLVDALQYMIARGGTPVMHGSSHQYRGTTGDDFEFWQGREDRALPGDSADLVIRKLKLGLAECFAAGIFPIAFETPHYGASELDYAAMQTIFHLFYERTMATPAIAATQYFPYQVVDRFGRSVAPENLGYIPLDDQNPRILIDRARNLRVVRDAVASFYFHPFLNPALLTEAVQGVSDLGYRFVSLREFGGKVDDGGRYVVTTLPRTVRMAPDNEFWRMRVYESSGKLVREQISASRLTGPVEVTAPVPPGGWAALDCLKDPPVKPKTSGAGDKRRKAAGVKISPTGSASILWLDSPALADANNQQSYRAVLESFGYRAHPLRVADFTSPPREAGSILVVPQGAGLQLSGGQRQSILNYVAEGGFLVADGSQPWLSALGLRFSGRQIPVANVVDALYPEMPLQWRPPEMVERFTPPQGARQLMVDAESRQMVALGGDHGAGRYLYLAARLDPYTTDAISRYPFFADQLAEAFRRYSTVRNPRVEIYFDPGYRQGVDLNHLAGTWRQAGVRAVYVAAWHVYPRYSFDYENLVRLCHQNGLAVYAWFVLPEVTPKMWEEHPEWRERTAAGGDGNVGWRLAMNLQNPACFRAAMEYMKQTLAAHPWDGVNLTELNYDADLLDRLRPDRFVPMNGDVRAEFRSRAGFDPAQLFAPGSPYYHKRNPAALEKFLAYREDVVTAWHRNVLKEIAPLQQARGWEVIVTMLDSLHSNFVRPALGVNAHRIIDLMKEFDFTLQVEDAAEHWAEPPDRYLRFAKTYQALVPDRRRLMFDVNVMPNRDVGGTRLPSSLMTGTELARTAMAAASASGRVAVYSEYTVASQDWALIGQALASPANLDPSGSGWEIESGNSLRLLASEEQRYYLNGQLWPVVSSEGVTVPAGRNRLSIEPPWYRFLERGELPSRVLHISADVAEARVQPTGLSLRYTSPSPTVILLNAEPRGTLLDGQSRDLAAQRSGDNWWLVAPRGEHRIEIATAGQAGVVLNLWSWLSASAIVLFGALTTLAMVGIYLQIRIRRRMGSRAAL